jgi:hypothetical protein
MDNRTFFVTFVDHPRVMAATVIAATVEFHGEHLAFVDSHDTLAALFVLDTVKSWNVLPLSYAPQAMGSPKAVWR